jgi:SAM-dependent methyltransferase
MYEPNVERVLAALGPADVVLDIGGWARPFNRADWVLDAEPYDTRGWYGLPPQGGEHERFSADRWIRRDICEHTPFPFADKSVDFVICSHVLEDVRDPLWVCREMMRVARRGYLEVPSRVAETCRGVEPGQVGWSHHRWLIDIGNEGVVFLMKYHTIHSHWRLSFPSSVLRGLEERAKVQWLFWDDRFACDERTIHGADRIAAELAGFVERVHPYPAWLVRADAAARAVGRLPGRVARGLGARLGGSRGGPPPERDA